MKERITILDGFRVVAILIVMLFHYYSRFYEELYFYNFNGDIFSFGYLGVEFFFIISGFVITLTLEKCSNFLEFAKKRLIRLIPGMVICSITTFIIFSLFDYDNIFPVSSMFKNLIFSNTFIYPELANKVIGSSFNYIDGAYWSLWVEISFYTIVAFLYFYDKKNLERNYFIISFLGVLFYFVFISEFGISMIGNVIGKNVYLFFRAIATVFPFLAYGLWFLVGMLLLKLFKDKKKIKYIFYMFGLMLFQCLLLQGIGVYIFCLFILMLLLLFIYKPTTISFLGNKFISRLGLVSYSVYLIHQNIGILAIHNLSKYFNGFNWVIGLVLIVLCFGFGMLSYKYVEVAIGKKIKKFLF